MAGVEVSGSAVTRISGRAISLPGNDIDTDRIMPARFLKAVTFEGLEAHVFEDDRKQARERGQLHAFDDTTRRDAKVFLTGVNFGCGSSREHAPQALYRWGIRAVVGVSYAEIFAGNSLMIGLACVEVTAEDLNRLRSIAADPVTEFTVDLAAKRITVGDTSVPITMPSATREALISGAWDATGMLLENYGDVRATAQRLPYIAGF